MKRKYVVIGAILLLAVIVAGVIWTEKVVQQRTAHFIRDAVSAQQFSRGLEGGIVGRRKCFPEGQSRQCTTVTYDIGRATCIRMARESKLPATSSEGGDCGPVYGTFKYDGRVVNVFIGDGVLTGQYWLQAWVTD
jgi:hypothetical protein